MQTVTADSWSHLQDLLFEEAWNADIGRYRSPWAFRGLSRADYPLTTTLMRLGGNYPRLEGHLIRNFKKYAHRESVERDSFWHWLSVAQHHGLPTRLLDWTYSPLIAMHFATAHIDKVHLDGAIWMIHYEAAHRILPQELRRELMREGANTYTAEMLARAAPSLAQFDSVGDALMLLMFEPPSMNDRIVNQYALFSVMSSPEALVEDWAERHQELCRKIVVPAELKWEIRDKLDQSNITERVLFPGLDGLTAWLRRHYSPREGTAAGASREKLHSAGP